MNTQKLCCGLCLLFWLGAVQSDTHAPSELQTEPAPESQVEAESSRSATEVELTELPTYYKCTYDAIQRVIEIVYSDDKPVPCQVMYRKENNQTWESTQVWNADSQVGYCEARAAEFVEKHRNWGFECVSRDDE